MPVKDRAPLAGPEATSNKAAAGRQGNDTRGGFGCRPLLWNPQDPNQLFLPSIRTASTGEDASMKKGDSSGLLAPLEVQYEVALAEGGADCNDYELLALTRILEAHTSYHHNNNNYYYGRDAAVGPPPPTPRRGKEEGAAATTPFYRIQALLERYVGAIRDCLQGWDAASRRRTIAGPKGGSTDEDDTVMEVHPSPQEGCDVDVDDIDNLTMLRYMYGIVSLSHTYLRLMSPLSPILGGAGVNPWDYPGLVSADLVRFLRGTYPWIADSPGRALGSIALEEFDGAPTPIDWGLVRSFVLCGMLEPAWECLRRDPTYITAKWRLSHDPDDAQSDTLRYAYQGIVDETEAIGLLLLVAPLPGLRAASNPGEDDGHVNSMLEELTESDNFSGLRPSDALGWDAPVDGYSHREAARKHELWQRGVREYIRDRKTRGDGAFRREFDPLLAVMAGDVREVEFGSWAEELCATILYMKPSMTPRQVSDCAARIAESPRYLHYSDMESPPTMATDLVPVFVTEGLVGLLKGGVDNAVSALWSLGGSSGAALPSAVMTLMYTMYIAAEVKDSAGAFLAMEKADLLCRTSTAILSSVHPLQSALMSIQLMVPYALEDGLTELVEAIAATLERHSPADFSIASRLIDMCRPLIERQAVDVMDGCCSVLLACYRDLSSSGQYGDAVFCLRKGVEVEALVLRGDVRFEGSIYRTLGGLCNRVVRQLADDFHSRDGFLSVGETSSVIEMAEAMIQGLEGHPNGDLVSVIPSVRVLQSVVASCRGGTSIGDRAVQLVACLRPEVRSNGRLRPTVAHHSLCWRLMQMAYKILLAVEQHGNQLDDDPTAALDADGIAILMKRLADLRSWDQAKPHPERLYNETELANMECVLGKALKRAFVTKGRAEDAGRTQSKASKSNHEGFFNFPLMASDEKRATLDRMLDG